MSYGDKDSTTTKSGNEFIGDRPADMVLTCYSWATEDISQLSKQRLTSN